MKTQKALDSNGCTKIKQITLQREKKKERERYPEPSVCKNKRLKQHKAAFGCGGGGGGGGPQILRVLEWKESKATPKLHYVICVFKRQR